MISLQTNVDSLNAQRNLDIDNEFQSNTIAQLTSGYRINKSGDDAAGLAIANGYESQIAELSQGVNNANDGVSQLQIVDGGLSNISTILNRLKTLATESASSTFTGQRSTLNQEYAGLINEINRQATNINLNDGGTFNNLLSVFIGGGSDTGNTNTVTIDLSGESNAVDATSLGLSTTNVLGGGAGFAGNSVRLDQSGVAFLTGSNTGKSETFSFNLYSGGSAQTISAVVSSTGTGGITGTTVLSQLNATLNKYGITASTAGNGALQFSGATAFNVDDAAGTGSTLITASGTGVKTSTSNDSNYVLSTGNAFAALTASTDNDILNVQAGGQSVNVTLTNINAGSITSALSTINAKTAQYGVYAVESQAGGVEFQSANGFSVNESFSSTGDDTGALGTGTSYTASTAPTEGTTNNATAAITAIDSAINALGLVQGSVGAGENKLQYAINLAQSQISSFSAAESQIKDADVAEQAANLTKAQVLTQTSIAALAQANSEPQAVLKLLQS